MSTTVRDARCTASLVTGRRTAPIDTRTAVDWIDRLGLRDKAVLTIDETASVLRVSDRTVRERIKAGQLPALRIGRRVVVPVPRLVNLLLDGIEMVE